MGLNVEQWRVKTQESVDLFKIASANIEINCPPPVGIHLLIGDNAKEKLSNQAKNLKQDRASDVVGITYKQIVNPQIIF